MIGQCCFNLFTPIAFWHDHICYVELWKESLKSKHFYLYQQNEQSPPTSNHRPQKKDHTGNPDNDYGHLHTCGGAKPVNGIPTPLDNWISDDNADIKKQYKIKYTESLLLKNTKMNCHIELGEKSVNLQFLFWWPLYRSVQ